MALENVQPTTTATIPEIRMPGASKQKNDAAAMPVKGTLGELVKVVTMEAPLVPVAVGPTTVELPTGKP